MVSVWTINELLWHLCLTNAVVELDLLLTNYIIIIFCWECMSALKVNISLFFAVIHLVKSDMPYCIWTLHGSRLILMYKYIQLPYGTYPVKMYCYYYYLLCGLGTLCAVRSHTEALAVCWMQAFFSPDCFLFFCPLLCTFMTQIEFPWRGCYRVGDQCNFGCQA